MTAAAPDTASPWPGVEVPLAKVEQTLKRQYEQLTDGDGQVGSRTRVATLVAVAADPAAGRTALDLVQGLRGRNPSRCIVLVTQPPGATTGARAFARVAHQPGTRRRQRRVWDEVVVEAAMPAEHLPSVVLPLLLPEIPVFAWWLGSPEFGQDVVTELLRVADRLVVDSTRFTDPLADLGRLARGAPGFPPTSDCAWGRLTPWREALATSFDCQPLRPALDQITGVTVTAGAPTAGLLMIAWLASRLDWTAAAPAEGGRLRYTTPDGRELTAELHVAPRGPSLQSVRVTARSGEQDAALSVDPVGDHLVATVTVGGRPATPPRVGAGQLTRSEALQAELDTFGRDRIYEQALAATLPWTAESGTAEPGTAAP